MESVQKEIPTAYNQINQETISKIVEKVEGLTPVFVYYQNYLIQQAHSLIKNFKKEESIDTTIRFAMKACSNINILKIFDREGLHFDCSSVYEAIRVINAGIDPSKIDLATQELTKPQLDMLAKIPGSERLHFIASSFNQLDLLMSHESFKNQVEGIRINPGFGSGFHSKTCVAGPSYSFGIWHHHIDKIRKDFKIRKIHSHIGAGSDPVFWLKSAQYLLNLIETHFPDVEIINLGGGFKIHRGEGDSPTDIADLAEKALGLIKEFQTKTNRKLKLEIEPGTFLVANSAVLLSEVIDIVSTHSPHELEQSEGNDSYEFLKLNTGLNDITRPSLYGAQHDIKILPGEPRGMCVLNKFVVVVGHCCESGDLLTTERDHPDIIREVNVRNDVQIGDYAIIKGSGAYCSSMSLKNYNSFPESSEVLIDNQGEVHVIRKRQELSQISENEIDIIQTN